MTNARFVLAKRDKLLIIAAPDPKHSGTWLCELWEPGTSETHRRPHHFSLDGTWVLARHRREPAPDSLPDERAECRACRIMKEMVPYLRDPEKGEYVTSYQWNGRLRTIGRPRLERPSRGKQASEGASGGTSASDDIGPGGLAALKPENQS